MQKRLVVTQLDPIGASAKSLTKEMGLPVASEVWIGFGTTAGTDESLRHIWYPTLRGIFPNLEVLTQKCRDNKKIKNKTKHDNNNFSQVSSVNWSRSYKHYLKSQNTNSLKYWFSGHVVPFLMAENSTDCYHFRRKKAKPYPLAKSVD